MSISILLLTTPTHLSLFMFGITAQRLFAVSIRIGHQAMRSYQP